MTDLRQIITEDVERVMRERGDWPEDLCYIEGREGWLYDEKAFLDEEHAEFMLVGALAVGRPGMVWMAGSAEIADLARKYMDLYGDKNDG